MNTQTTLRDLAKSYARNAISKEKYRKSRSELIKGIIAGQISVKAIDYLPPISPAEEEAVTETAQQRDRSKTEIRPEQVAKSNKSTPVKLNHTPRNEKKLPWLFISISTAVVLLLIITVILFYPAPPTTTKTIVETTSTNATEENETSKAGEALIANFLAQKNWSEESLDAFNTSWSSLTQEERDTASQTKRMQRMRASIYKQFLEEKALASIDSEKAIMKQQKLIEFANAIGIDDSRMVLD